MCLTNVLRKCLTDVLRMCLTNVLRMCLTNVFRKCLTKKKQQKQTQKQKQKQKQKRSKAIATCRRVNTHAQIISALSRVFPLIRLRACHKSSTCRRRMDSHWLQATGGSHWLQPTGGDDRPEQSFGPYHWTTELWLEQGHPTSSLSVIITIIVETINCRSCFSFESFFF